MAKTKELKTQPCASCGGLGTMPADDVGPILKPQRDEKGIRAVDMAKYLDISDTFLYDLERGNRRWTNELVAGYLKGLEELS